MIKDVSNINLVNTPMSGGDLLKPGAFGIPKGRLLNEFHGNWNPKQPVLLLTCGHVMECRHKTVIFSILKFTYKCRNNLVMDAAI